MKKLLVLLLLSVSVAAHAQILTDPLLYLAGHASEGERAHIYLEGAYSVNSNSLTNSLYNRYMFNNYLDDASKSSVIPRLKNNIRFGASTEASLLYDWKSKKNKLVYSFVGWKDRSQIGSLFSGDIYKLIAFGNAQFAGQYAYLTPDSRNTYYRKIRYQELQFGMFKIFGRKKDYVVGGSVGLTGGVNYIFADIKNGGFLYTSFLGDSVHLKADIKAQRINQQPGYFNFEGTGLAGNFFLRMPAGKKGILRISISDIGFIHWNDSAKSIHLNNDWIFTGADVSVINGNINYSGVKTLPDSLAKQIGQGWKVKSFNSVLPAQLHVVYDYTVGKKSALTAGLEYNFFFSHLPSLYFLADLSVWKKLRIQAGLEALGYGNYGIMLGSSLQWHNWDFKLGTNHIEGYLTAAKTGGQGVYLCVGKGI